MRQYQVEFWCTWDGTCGLQNKIPFEINEPILGQAMLDAFYLVAPHDAINIPRFGLNCPGSKLP